MDDAIYFNAGSASAEEVDYLLDLLLMTLLRAEGKYGDNFRLHSKWERAGKFDDLVLTYKDNPNNKHHHNFLQVKHVEDEKKTITYEDLISDDKFSIKKYFKSYQEIEKNLDGKIDDLILFSNLALNENVKPFVDPIPSKHPIFHFQQIKKDGTAPVMHKLNSKFSKDFEYSKLRRIATTFLNCCFKDIEIKATNNVFKDCHVILSTDVVNVTEGKFHVKFIDNKDLSVETRKFRKILLEELQAKNKEFLSGKTQTQWLRNKLLKFSFGFGNISLKKEAANIWPIVLISPKDERVFKNFCKLFILASSQPNDEKLKEHIRAELNNRCSQSKDCLATDFLHNKLRIWFKTVPSKPLNSTFLKDALKYNEKELKFIYETNRNIRSLSPLQLEFEKIPYEGEIVTFLNQSESSILIIKTTGNMKVSLMKLFYNLQKLQFPDYFFITETELSKAIDLLKVFEDSESFNILIAEMQGTNQSKEVIGKLQHLIQNDGTKKKKIIVVTQKEVVLSFDSSLFLTVEDATYFEQLKVRSRQLLLDRRIAFQGTEIALNSILSNGIPLNHQDTQSWGCLIEETISINSQRDAFDLGYYINRTLHGECHFFDKSTIQKQLGDQHIVTYSLTDFNREILHSGRHVHRLEELDGAWCWRTSNSGVRDLLRQSKGIRQSEINDNDDNFLDFGKEIMIISGPAGNGKTTITSYLATELMKKNKHYWVTRLSSLSWSFTMEEIHLTAASNNTQYDLFLMKKLFEVSTPLERLIFEQYLKEEKSQSKLIFIFDGFDEINVEGQNVLIQALKYLKQKENVKFIGISTRPQHQQQLEEELQSRTWTLRPFNEDNKITFLAKFWSSRAAIEQCDKMREFSTRLIASISRSISEGESELTGPLQMRMIAEIYKENAKKYVANDIEEHLALPPFDFFELYEQFIKKKEDVYLDVKLGINQNAVQRSVTIEHLRKIQIKFALRIIVGSKRLPSDEDLDECIGLGIIQKSQNKQFSFIHLTFAEFLTAKYLIDANVSLWDKMRKGQLIRVRSGKQFSVVRQFMKNKFDFRKSKW